MDEPHDRSRGSPGSPSLALCLFGSGLCALVCQTTWLREFRLFFGASTAASAAVLAIFMGGLGVGSLLLGPRADKSPNPLRRYALLELGVAAAAAVTPFLLDLVRGAYVALGGTPSLGTAGGAAARLVLASFVLAAPTVLMGGTLPAAIRAAQKDRDASRRGAALLYGMNTVGAVAGALLATFVLLERLGNRGTLWSACALNACVGLAALALSRAARPASSADGGAARAAPPVAPAAPPRAVLAAAAVSGFTFFLLELVWYRMLGPLLGGSTFTFGLILAVALAGIALGSLAFAAFLGGRRVTAASFALVCAAQAAAVAAPYALGDRIVTLTTLLQPLGSLGFPERVAQWGITAAIVVGPASFLSGVQFPMLLALLGRGRRDVAAHTGAAYAWNTVGAIAGSLAGGFGLLPLLTAPGAWRLVVVLLALLAAGALFATMRRGASGLRLLPAAVVGAAAMAMTFADGPTAAWRHSPVGAGRVRIAAPTANGLREHERLRRRSLLWEADGVESAVGVSGEDGYAFLVNGKTDGNAYHDAPTQVMLGLLPALVHPEPRDAFVVGLGTGSTAGWLAEVPTVRTVDVVELEPAVRTVAELCSRVNCRALENPKVRLRFGDAREEILAGEGSYDVIASEPSNPYRAGVATLFSREFYVAAERRLRKGGVFVQWLQTYEVDGPSVCGVYATLRSVFPAVETWASLRGDVLLVASREPIVHDVARLRRRVAEEPYRSALAAVWQVSDAEGVFGRYVGNAGLGAFVARSAGEIHTDDRNGLEFAFARTVGLDTSFDPDMLFAAARVHGFDQPHVTGGVLDGPTVADRRVSARLLASQRDVVADSDDAAHRERTAAKAAYARGDLAAARDAWFRQRREPGDRMELLLVAHSLAWTLDPRAPQYIDLLAAQAPADAALVDAQRFLQASRPDEALARAADAFLLCRRDPWVRPPLLRTTLARVREAVRGGGARPEAVQRALDALSEPFSVRMADDERIRARFEIACLLDAATGATHAVDALAEMEPWTPWDQAFLSARADAYRRARHPLADHATAELAEFLAAEPPPFAFPAPAAATRSSSAPRPAAPTAGGPGSPR